MLVLVLPMHGNNGVHICEPNMFNPFDVCVGTTKHMNMFDNAVSGRMKRPPHLLSCYPHL